MKIVTYQKTARDKLLAFIGKHQFERIRLCESDSDAGRTLYLEQDGQVLGIATLFHNAFHPNFENLRLAVDTRDEPLVTTLVEALLNRHSQPSSPLSLHVTEQEAINLAGFLARHHFTQVLKTECPQIDIEKSLAGLTGCSLPAGYRRVAYHQLDEAEASQLRAFRLQGYEKTHFWSPPLSIESPVWNETDVEAESQALSWVVFRQDAIVMCSDAHLEDEDVYLGWGWHDDAYDSLPELQRIWSSVLSLQLQACLQTGKRLIGEFDSTDKYGQYKSALLTPLRPENFYTFQRRQPVPIG